MLRLQKRTEAISGKKSQATPRQKSRFAGTQIVLIHQANRCRNEDIRDPSLCATTLPIGRQCDRLLPLATELDGFHFRARGHKNTQLQRTDWCPRQESNLNLEFRKPSFYPLNYGGDDRQEVDSGEGNRWQVTCQEQALGILRKEISVRNRCLRDR